MPTFRSAVIIFLSFLCLYLSTMPPALAPYRDSGEMTVSASTLGVSHPTSYPLYILAGKIAELFPLGNPAYRLTLLSASGGAAAVAGVFLLFGGGWPGMGAGVLLGLNPVFWQVALVPEMYSLWILGAAGLAALALAARGGAPGWSRPWAALAFLYGLLLGNRMDLLLWAPGILWLALTREEGEFPGPSSAGLWTAVAGLAVPAAVVAFDANWLFVLLIVGTALWLRRGEKSAWAARSLGWALLGLSIYLFLPLRSRLGPWLDWNHPADPANLLESLTRSKYGGTLDLLSKSYAKGELFGANLLVYGRHLWETFSAVGLLAVLWGSGSMARDFPRRWLGWAAAYWWSGPVFIFMANLPPNPHAAAIVEPHYLLSDLVLVMWAGGGLRAAVAASKPLGFVLAVAILVVPFLGGRFRSQDRRSHFFSYDYARSVLLSVPKGAVFVAKKDVQLYSLWHYQLLHGRRPDVRIVAQGLAGSPWYRAGWARRDPSLALGPLRDEAQWRAFTRSNARVLAGNDAEVPAGLETRTPRGLAADLAPGPDAREAARGAWELVARRGNYSYGDQPDFFTSDLIADFAAARHQEGSLLARAGAWDAAVENLRAAWEMHWLLPEPPMMLGFVEISRGRLEQAAVYYGLSALLNERLGALADAYSSLPELKSGLRKGGAEARLHQGVVAERRGDKAAAEAFYRQSLALAPMAQAHFNLAVLYWERDWPAVERELESALRIEPGNAEARKYLAMARARRREK